MSGTDETKEPQAGTEEEGTPSGTDTTNEEIQSLKQQIADLRRESAKYRTTAKEKETEKLTVEQRLQAMQDELKNTKQEATRTKHEALLEKAGCIKSDLVAQVVPQDCEDVQAWIESYKKDNALLFKQEARSHGGGYKPSGSSNLTPNQQINAFIRSASGRN